MEFGPTLGPVPAPTLQCRHSYGSSEGYGYCSHKVGLNETFFAEYLCHFEIDIKFNCLVAHLLLGPEVDEVGTHGVLLTAPELVHAEGGGHVLVRHLVPDPPPHVHHLVLQPVLLPAVLLDLGIHVLHQGVPLHQHVREGGAREDPDNLILRIVQCHDFAPLLGSGYICIVKLDRTEIQFYKEGKSTANTFALFNLNQSF